MYWLYSPERRSPGSLATFTAMRRASSVVSTLAMLACFVRAAERRSADRSDHTAEGAFASLEPSLAVAIRPSCRQTGLLGSSSRGD